MAALAPVEIFATEAPVDRTPSRRRGLPCLALLSMVIPPPLGLEHLGPAAKAGRKSPEEDSECTTDTDGGDWSPSSEEQTSCSEALSDDEALLAADSDADSCDPADAGLSVRQLAQVCSEALSDDEALLAADADSNASDTGLVGWRRAFARLARQLAEGEDINSAGWARVGGRVAEVLRRTVDADADSDTDDFGPADVGFSSWNRASARFAGPLHAAEDEDVSPEGWALVGGRVATALRRVADVGVDSDAEV